MLRTASLASPRSRLLVAAVVLAVVAAGCLRGPGDDNANGGLGGTSWVVTSVAGTATLVDARPTVAFAVDGVVSGTDGCNVYSGQFRTDGDQIGVGPLASTLIGCEPLLGAQAQAFTQALGGAATWRLTEAGSLEIRGHGDLIADPAPPAQPGASAGLVSDLAGTSWVLEELETGPILDAVPSVAFGADGTVSGSTGCNTFNGTYRLDGTNLAFGPLATTKRGCADSTMLVESAFLVALAGVTTWSITSAGRLVLDGRSPLTFGPA